MCSVESMLIDTTNYCQLCTFDLMSQIHVFSSPAMIWLPILLSHKTPFLGIPGSQTHSVFWETLDKPDWEPRANSEYHPMLGMHLLHVWPWTWHDVMTRFLSVSLAFCYENSHLQQVNILIKMHWAKRRPTVCNQSTWCIQFAKICMWC